ncbi:hypothetical protein NKR23_g11984 [Pleurostoma richardsiae]|uniref:Helicase C-terminal domain-containing protein n=1 Tax=Pleurostoma richardsiae TaxID=41990 RepID=A0AA38RFV2_9PEZI|nr:hypothetical protein NKR23_g11984 [Pleurostoma richardsiae]
MSHQGTSKDGLLAPFPLPDPQKHTLRNFVFNIWSPDELGYRCGRVVSVSIVEFLRAPIHDITRENISMEALHRCLERNNLTPDNGRILGWCPGVPPRFIRIDSSDDLWSLIEQVSDTDRLGAGRMPTVLLMVLREHLPDPDPARIAVPSVYTSPLPGVERESDPSAGRNADSDGDTRMQSLSPPSSDPRAGRSRQVSIKDVTMRSGSPPDSSPPPFILNPGEKNLQATSAARELSLRIKELFGTGTYSTFMPTARSVPPSPKLPTSQAEPAPTQPLLAGRSPSPPVRRPSSPYRAERPTSRPFPPRLPIWRQVATRAPAREKRDKKPVNKGKQPEGPVQPAEPAEPKKQEDVGDAAIDEEVLLSSSDVLNTLDDIARAKFDMICEFLLFNPAGEEWKKGKRLKHTKKTLTHAQIFGAVLSLLPTLNDCPGAFLADEPGMGKTWTYYGQIVLRYLLRQSRDSVKNGEAGHIFDAAPGPCPKASTQWGIDCYCKGRLAKSLADNMAYGPNLVVTLPANVEQALQMAEDFLGGPFKAYLQHATSKRRITLLEKSKLSSAVRVEDQGVADGEKTSTILLTPRKGVDHVVLIYSSAGMRNLEKDFSRDINAPLGGGRTGSKQERVTCLLPGYVCLDECHEYTTSQTPVIRMLTKLKSHITPSPGKPFFTLFCTGTPFGKGPGDALHPLALLERQSWSTKASPMFCARAQTVRGLAHAFYRLTQRPATDADHSKKSADRQYFCKDWRKIMTQVMTRRLFHSRIAGVPVSGREPVPPRVVECDIPAQYLDDITELAESARKHIQAEAPRLGQDEDTVVEREKHNAHIVKVRLTATFPALAPFLREEGVDASLRSEAITQYMQNFKESPYWGLLPRIIQDSAKAAELENVIIQARNDRELLDGRSYRKKMLVFSEIPAEAAFTYAFLLWLQETKHRHRDLRVEFLHEGVRADKRNHIVKKFSEARVGSTNVLVSTVRLASTGLNLQAANYVVMMSPCWLLSHQTQAFARVDRNGQKLAVHPVLLTCPGNPIDRGILSRQAALSTLGVDKDQDVPMADDTQDTPVPDSMDVDDLKGSS